MNKHFCENFEDQKNLIELHLIEKGINPKLAKSLIQTFRDFLDRQIAHFQLNKLARQINKNQSYKHEKTILVYILFFVFLDLQSLIGFQFTNIMPFDAILETFEEDEAKKKKIRDSLTTIEITNIERAYNMMVSQKFESKYQVVKFDDWARVFLTFCGHEICISQTGSGITKYFLFWCKIFRIHFKIPIRPRTLQKSVIIDKDLMMKLRQVLETHGDMPISVLVDKFESSKALDSVGGAGGGGGAASEDDGDRGGDVSSSTRKRSREEFKGALSLIEFAGNPEFTKEKDGEDDEEDYVVMFCPPEPPSKR